ncbi:MAG TPA: cytochrome c3 family protein [Thermoanaerobaculia bacterium]|nr:cytochrome c3 family protein [Thermoanaerobaculia bacterium]
MEISYENSFLEGRGSLRAPSSPSGLGGSIESDLLVDGRIECTSCHNPHATETRSMLRIDNTGSRLCLACHDK